MNIFLILKVIFYQIFLSLFKQTLHIYVITWSSFIVGKINNKFFSLYKSLFLYVFWLSYGMGLKSEISLKIWFFFILVLGRPYNCTNSSDVDIDVLSSLSQLWWFPMTTFFFDLSLSFQLSVMEWVTGHCYCLDYCILL